MKALVGLMILGFKATVLAIKTAITRPRMPKPQDPPKQ